MNTKLKSILPHLLVIVGFMLVSVMYVSPVLKGKSLKQSDALQGAAWSHEVTTYQKETGEYSAWTNAMFGGMPSYMIAGGYTKGILPTISETLYKFLWGYGGMIMHSFPTIL